MAKVKTATTADKKKDMRAALTPDAREQQLIYLATELAAKQLMDGTASSQVITHYLKLGSSKERLEQDILKENKKLLKAKTEAIESAKRVEELYSEAIVAMRKYSGHGDDEYEPEEA